MGGASSTSLGKSCNINTTRLVMQIRDFDKLQFIGLPAGDSALKMQLLQTAQKITPGQKAVCIQDLGGAVEMKFRRNPFYADQHRWKVVWPVVLQLNKVLAVAGYMPECDIDWCMQTTSVPAVVYNAREPLDTEFCCVGWTDSSDKLRVLAPPDVVDALRALVEPLGIRREKRLCAATELKLEGSLFRMVVAPTASGEAEGVRVRQLVQSIFATLRALGWVHHCSFPVPIFRRDAAVARKGAVAGGNEAAAAAAGVEKATGGVGGVGGGAAAAVLPQAWMSMRGADKLWVSGFGGATVDALRRQLVACTGGAPLQGERVVEGAVQFQLRGQPWEPSSVRLQHDGFRAATQCFVALLNTLAAAGWVLTHSLPARNGYAPGFMYRFAHQPQAAAATVAGGGVTAVLEPFPRDKLRVWGGDSAVSAVRGVLAQHWPRGTSEEKAVGTEGEALNAVPAPVTTQQLASPETSASDVAAVTQFKLKGLPWECDKEQRLSAHVLVLQLIHRMEELGYRLLTSCHTHKYFIAIHSDTAHYEAKRIDALFFTGGPQQASAACVPVVPTAPSVVAGADDPAVLKQQVLAAFPAVTTRAGSVCDVAEPSLAALSVPLLG